MGGSSVGNPMLCRISRAVVGSVMSSTNFSLPPQGQARESILCTLLSNVAQSIRQGALKRGSPSLAEASLFDSIVDGVNTFRVPVGSGGFFERDST